MSILRSVDAAPTQYGQRIVISAQEKIGKTTLGTNAPRALLIPCEVGFASVRTPKTRLLTSFRDVMDTTAEIKVAAQRGQFPFNTITWDSATAIERFIHDEVIQSDPKWAKGNRAAITMESAHGGYGKAYLRANELFMEWLNAMDELAIHGKINVVVTCHVFPSKVIDPTAGEFQQWDLLLHSPKDDRKYGKRELITQWADMVGFLHEPIFVMKAGDGERMNRAVSANQGRVIAVDRTPAYVAGNRYGLTGTIAIPPANGWNHIAQAIYANTGIDVYNRD